MVVREAEVEFAVRDGAHIAYEIFGSGPVDLVMLPNSTFPIDLMWDLPQLASFLDSLGEMARVIAFDQRGMGASDPLPTIDGAAGTEALASDILAVMDAAGSERASIITFYTAGTSELLFAATYPHRVRSLILSNLRTSYPEVQNMTLEQRTAIASWLPTPRGLKFFEPRHAHDPVMRRWWGRAHRLVGSPQQIAREMEYAASCDTMSILEQIRTPTLVFHRQGNQMWDIETSRSAAARMPDARFVELPGSETSLFLGDTGPILDEIRRFLGEPEALSNLDNRQLATVLFTDIVASTERLASLGDEAWRSVLDDHDTAVDRLVTVYRGRLIKRLGDGMLATFDGPARAVRCAASIQQALRASGIHLRAGLHTGEIEMRDRDVAGLGVHIASRISGLSEPGEILVSRTVVDLTGGSGITYDSRGEHALKGIPGRWPIFAAQVPPVADA